MANKKFTDICGGLNPVIMPRMKGDKDPSKPMNEQKKSTSKTDVTKKTPAKKTDTKKK